MAVKKGILNENAQVIREGNRRSPPERTRSILGHVVLVDWDRSAHSTGGAGPAAHRVGSSPRHRPPSAAGEGRPRFAEAGRALLCQRRTDQGQAVDRTATGHRHHSFPSRMARPRLLRLERYHCSVRLCRHPRLYRIGIVQRSAAESAPPPGPRFSRAAASSPANPRLLVRAEATVDFAPCPIHASNSPPKN